MSRRIAFVVLLGVSLAVETSAQGDPLAPLRKDGEVITARWRAGALPLDPAGAEWQALEPARITLYPQSSVRPGSGAGGSRALSVRALYNKRDLALHLEWADSQRAARHDIGRFPDAVAVQWPIRYGPEVKLPYVGMGHAGHPVSIWFWRADGRVETLAAEGFGSLTPQPSDGIVARTAWEKGAWKVVLKRSLSARGSVHLQMKPSTAGLVPVAFAVWSGEAGQRDGDKFLSPWCLLHFERGKVDPGYITRLLWSPRVKGDPGAGRALMTAKGCIACHAYPGNPLQAETGPNLTYAGGIHRPDYLRESIADPSAVIVPGKTFSTFSQGTAASTMPALAVSESELVHLVEYLRTLR